MKRLWWERLPEDRPVTSKERRIDKVHKGTTTVLRRSTEIWCFRMWTIMWQILIKMRLTKRNQEVDRLVPLTSKRNKQRVMRPGAIQWWSSAGTCRRSRNHVHWLVVVCHSMTRAHRAPSRHRAAYRRQTCSECHRDRTALSTRTSYSPRRQPAISLNCPTQQSASPLQRVVRGVRLHRSTTYNSCVTVKP